MSLFLSILFSASAEPIINSWEEVVSPPQVSGLFWQEQRQILIEECSYDVQHCQKIYTLDPRPTRNPSIFRFTDPEMFNAQLIPLHLARFYDPQTPEYIRLALLDVLRRTEGDWEEGLLDALNDSSPSIRIAIADITRYASPDFAADTLPILATDSVKEVRASALRAIGYQESNDYQAALEAALQDEDANVRYSAVRSIGWTQPPTPVSKITPLLADSDANVRLHALRTISRLYPDIAGKLPELQSLQSDPDPKVQREAFRLAQ